MRRRTVAFIFGVVAVVVLGVGAGVVNSDQQAAVAPIPTADYHVVHDWPVLPLLTLGERGVAGNDSSHFNRPTDVAVASDGTLYVSDGYENSRVVKFARDGRYGNYDGQFLVAHAVAVGRGGEVYVADVTGRRVQKFVPGEAQ